MYQTVDGIVATLEADATQYNAVMQQSLALADQIANEMKNTWAQADTSIAQTIGLIGSKLQSAGQLVSLHISNPIQGMLNDVQASVMELNANMANVSSLGVDESRVLELKQGVQDLAVSVGKDTKDMSAGLYEVISTFGESAETLPILEVNAKAAAAGLATVNDAIALTGAVTKSYGQESLDAQKKVSDLAFVAVNLGKTTFPELAASIGRVTPLAASLKLTQEELFGVMATATGVTGGAAEVSTQLRGVLQGLLDPTKDLTKLFKEQGIVSGQALIEQRGLKGALDLIAQAAKDTGKPMTDYFGSIEAVTLALTLTEGQADSFIDKTNAMRNATGATDEAFRRQTSGLGAQGFAMQQLAVKTEVMKQTLADALMPAYVGFLNINVSLMGYLEQAVFYFADMSEEARLFASTMVAVGAGIGPFLMSLGGIMRMAPVLEAGLTAVRSGMTSVVTAAAGFVIPWLPVVGVVAAVAAGVYGIAYAVMGPEGLNMAWELAKAYAMDTWEYIQGFIYNFQENMGILVEWLGENWQQLFIDIGQAVITYATNMVHNQSVMIQTVVRLYSAWLGWMSEAVPKFFNYIFSDEFIGAVLNGVKEGYKWYSDFVTRVVDKAVIMGEAIWEALKGNWEEARVLASQVMDSAVDAWDKGLEQVQKDFQAGAENENLFATWKGIIEEGVEELRSPLAGMEFNVEPPKFNVSMPKPEEVAAEIEQEVNVTAPVDVQVNKPSLDAAQKQIEAINESTKKAQEDAKTAHSNSVDIGAESYKIMASLAAKAEQEADVINPWKRLGKRRREKEAPTGTEDLDAMALVSSIPENVPVPTGDSVVPLPEINAQPSVSSLLSEMALPGLSTLSQSNHLDVNNTLSGMQNLALPEISEFGTLSSSQAAELSALDLPTNAQEPETFSGMLSDTRNAIQQSLQARLDSRNSVRAEPAAQVAEKPTTDKEVRDEVVNLQTTSTTNTDRIVEALKQLKIPELNGV